MGLERNILRTGLRQISKSCILLGIPCSSRPPRTPGGGWEDIEHTASLGHCQTLLRESMFCETQNDSSNPAYLRSEQKAVTICKLLTKGSLSLFKFLFQSGVIIFNSLQFSRISGTPNHQFMEKSFQSLFLRC